MQRFYICSKEYSFYEIIPTEANILSLPISTATVGFCEGRELAWSRDREGAQQQRMSVAGDAGMQSSQLVGAQALLASSLLAV